MKKIISFFPVLFLSIAVTSCHRSSREMWEDTKTASRHVKRGFESFLGRHIDEEPLAYDGGADLDYMPLVSEDELFVTSGHLPPAKESPGEIGSSIPGIEQFSTPMGELARLFANVHFDTDQYSVSGATNLTTLNAIADHLNKHPNVYVFIEGHADERGAAAYNLSLGSKRSNSVRAILAERGVSPDRLFTISYGKERPIVFGHDETSWKENRRAQFKTYEK